MNAYDRTVDVTRHAQTRWLQRVSGNDPYPASSIREAFEEAVDTESDNQLRRYHRDLNVLFVAVERGAVERVVTVYETASGGEK